MKMTDSRTAALTPWLPLGYHDVEVTSTNQIDMNQSGDLTTLHRHIWRWLHEHHRMKSDHRDGLSIEDLLLKRF